MVNSLGEDNDICHQKQTQAVPLIQTQDITDIEFPNL